MDRLDCLFSLLCDMLPIGLKLDRGAAKIKPLNSDFSSSKMPGDVFNIVYIKNNYVKIIFPRVEKQLRYGDVLEVGGRLFSESFGEGSFNL